MLGKFTRKEIQDFLAQYGFTSNPDGLAELFPVDCVYETESVAYFDVNADAVRKGNEVPDRPVRITSVQSRAGNWNPQKSWSVAQWQLPGRAAPHPWKYVVLPHQRRRP